MDAIFDLIGKVFNPILEMGGPVIMLIILTGNGHLEDLSKISEPEKLYAYIAEATA
ncbi:PTS system transporter subunit IIA [Streptococcus pneumoniae]|nr:PTS system transporter subunit IIA [Streptococcus pneumoniae]